LQILIFRVKYEPLGTDRQLVPASNSPFVGVIDRSLKMKKFLMCLALVGIVAGAMGCTEEEAKKAADASFACLTVMLPAAQECVNACIPTPVDEEGKLACEKTCVDKLVGDAGAMCGEEFGTEFKSEQFGTAVSALVKSAIMIYDALRTTTMNASACPPCPPCAVSAVDATAVQPTAEKK
jgi:hypothetical protein